MDTNKKYSIIYNSDGINIVSEDDFKPSLVIVNKKIEKDKKIEFDSDKKNIIYNSDGISFPVRYL